MKTKKTNAATMKMQQMYYNPKESASFGGKKRLAKQFSGKKVEKWLPTQLAYSLHKPIRKKFPTRKYRVGGINELWQMDILEMIPYAKINKGYKYILVCIDVFSRYARAFPCKTKSGEEVANLTLKMIKENNGKPPRCIQTDMGKEFYNSYIRNHVFNKHSIKHYSVTSQFKAPYVERLNRTLREKFNRYFTHKGNKVWYTILPQIIKTYNNTEHSGIFDHKPSDITSLNEAILWEMQNEKEEKTAFPQEKPLELLEYVRISHISVSSHFNKNFDQNWSDEVFRIVGIDTKSKPTMYIIEDMNNNVIEGKFYKSELQAIHEKPEIYRVEKILQTKGKGVYKQYLVKWHGYSKDHNSWIKASQIDKP